MRLQELRTFNPSTKPSRYLSRYLIILNFAKRLQRGTGEYDPFAGDMPEE